MTMQPVGYGYGYGYGNGSQWKDCRDHGYGNGQDNSNGSGIGYDNAYMACVGTRAESGFGHGFGTVSNKGKKRP